ncbi:hypothetical protein Zmor_013902 [Zophobas morio]|uniref:Uncharacterized protein n=1 Tax=Zophobas morio TaxID=2755281 RepID=A0AA38IIJ9_9CUCU|nr:hypothetical protein Zmor_013902 [Zophobas morio]
MCAGRHQATPGKSDVLDDHSSFLIIEDVIDVFDLGDGDAGHLTIPDEGDVDADIRAAEDAKLDVEEIQGMTMVVVQLEPQVGSGTKKASRATGSARTPTAATPISPRGISGISVGLRGDGEPDCRFFDEGAVQVEALVVFGDLGNHRHRVGARTSHP